MVYRFKLGESPDKGMRRILREQVVLAEQRLAKTGATAETVHDARKAFKRIRALLRLMRPGLGKTVFREQNAAFRTISGRLAAARDQHVLLQTMLMLEASRGGDLAPTFARMRKALEGTIGQAGPHADTAASVSQVRSELKAARKQVEQLQLSLDACEHFEHGLRQAHRRARDAMHAAFAQGTDEAFHEWRKGVQQHWRHMQLLGRAWPAYFEMRVAAAKVVAQLLGEDHDLSLLAQFSGELERSGLTQAEADAVIVLCRSLQVELRQQAGQEGRRLFADSPRGFGRHVAALWASASETAGAAATGRPKPAAAGRRPRKVRADRSGS